MRTATVGAPDPRHRQDESVHGPPSQLAGPRRRVLPDALDCALDFGADGRVHRGQGVREPRDGPKAPQGRWGDPFAGGVLPVQTEGLGALHLEEVRVNRVEPTALPVLRRQGRALRKEPNGRGGQARLLLDLDEHLAVGRLLGMAADACPAAGETPHAATSAEDEHPVAAVTTKQEAGHDGDRLHGL